MGSGADKMSPGHETPVTKLLPCALLSPDTRMMRGIWNVEFLHLSVASPLLFLTYTDSLARLALISNLIQMILGGGGVQGQG